MTNLSKEQADLLDLDILSQKYRVTDLAKKYGKTKGRISQRSKELLEGNIKLEKSKQQALDVAKDAKATAVNSAKLDTIHRRVVFLAILEARIKVYKRKFDQAADPQPGPRGRPVIPKITDEDEKNFLALVRATEPFLRGIDQAEAMAKALLGGAQGEGPVFDTGVYAETARREAEAFLEQLLPRLSEGARAEVLKAITEIGGGTPQ